jgi:hydroxymethylpyrimidine pyrophosphatase-like HAD family hydrolase
MKIKMLQEKIKVVISDLDGTLLNQEHRISEYTKTVLRTAQIKDT